MVVVMSEIVERVARILQNRDGCFDPGEELDPAFVEDARAVIGAMREPTSAMRDAAVFATDGPSCHMSAYHCAGLTWQAMIDAALKRPA